MKKFASLFFSLILTFSLSVSVSAATTDTEDMGNNIPISRVSQYVEIIPAESYYSMTSNNFRTKDGTLPDVIYSIDYDALDSLPLGEYELFVDTFVTGVYTVDTTRTTNDISPQATVTTYASVRGSYNNALKQTTIKTTVSSDNALLCRFYSLSGSHSIENSDGLLNTDTYSEGRMLGAFSLSASTTFSRSMNVGTQFHCYSVGTHGTNYGYTPFSRVHTFTRT